MKVRAPLVCYIKKELSLLYSFNVKLDPEALSIHPLSLPVCVSTRDWMPT